MSNRSVWQVAEKERQLSISCPHQLSLLLLLGSQIAAVNRGVWAKGREIHPHHKLPRREVLPCLHSSRKLKWFYSSIEVNKMFFPECSESTQTLQMLNNFLIFENLAPCPVFLNLVIFGSSEPLVVCTCPALSDRMGISSCKNTHKLSQSLLRPVW